jgi:hypothetical protein
VTKTEMRRIEFANGTLGCLTAFLLVFALVAFWLAGFADLSASSARGTPFFAWIQSIRIGNFPLGAAVLAGYFVFEGGKNGWRWADKTALTIEGDNIIIHPSYLKANMSFEDITSVNTTHRTSTWVKSINPALVIRWRDDKLMRDRNITIRNLNLDTPDAQAAIELFKSRGKWIAV